MTITHGSLFSGIGGFDLGFERAGIETIWQVEIEDYARRVLERHFPHAQRFSDIRDCGKHNLPPVDIVSGGFPCQDISNAGKRAGIDGERSGLWTEYARIISELRPSYVVVENSAALLGRGIGRILGDLAACGYDAEWDCLPAKAFGAPHERDRVFIVGYTSSNGLQEMRRVYKRPGPIAGSWWETEPKLDRVDYGFPVQVDRTKCVGNAIVPQIAEWIGRRIVEVVANGDSSQTSAATNPVCAKQD